MPIVTNNISKIDPTSTEAWARLKNLKLNALTSDLRALFDHDRQRVERFSIEWEDFYVDFSKNLLDEDTLQQLLALAREVKLDQGIEAMFSGAVINETEQREVLHTALRRPIDDSLILHGENIVEQVHQVLNQMEGFVDQIDQGVWKGYSGKTITDIVNIGIGGSDLGPLMVSEALRPYHNPNRQVHFVSNVDGADLSQTLSRLNPETTLFVIVSKTFTTIETMTNAQTAREWFLQKASKEQIAKHFVAVSTNVRGARQFGIREANIFGFWDWVGGRYSLSSAVGLSIMLATSPAHFRSLLKGMYAMDQHFRTHPWRENIPVLLALLGVWYTNFHQAETEAVLPYDQNLKYLPAYLQQASMESNGKSVDRAGQEVNYQTGAILWGGAGTNSQHSFFQLLHQGTKLIPCDFILPINPHHNLANHQDLLVSNLLAQTEALMRGKHASEVFKELRDAGKSEEEIRWLTPFKCFPGNRPSNMILIKKLTPFNLGALIAMYEHKIFVQGFVWNIFSFDQFGVELGKALAKAIQPELRGEIRADQHDPSTNAALKQFKKWREY